MAASSMTKALGGMVVVGRILDRSSLEMDRVFVESQD
jgi:hypothetical protein